MAKISFAYSDRELKANIGELNDRIDGALKAVSDYTAVEGTGYMKENAPWTDRTTNARNGLHAVADSPEKGKYEIVFAGTVYYQIYLELANSGRYAIIMPAVRHEGELLMQRLRGLLPRLKASR